MWNGGHMEEDGKDKKTNKKSELGRGNSTNISGQAVGGNIEVLANG